MIWETIDDIGIEGPYSEFCERACIGSVLGQRGGVSGRLRGT